MPSNLTKKLEALIGAEAPPSTMEIEKHDIQRFAVSIAWPNPPNPLYHDPEYAARSRFGGITAPPTFGTSLKWLRPLLERVEAVLIPYQVMMNGGSGLEIHAPIRPGDLITGSGRFARFKESPRPDGGALFILEFEGMFSNQRNEKVVTGLQRLLVVYTKAHLDKH